MINLKPLSNTPLDASVVIPTSSPLDTSINKVSLVLNSTNFNNITTEAPGTKSTYTLPSTSASPAFFGQNIIFTASLKSADGQGNPTGSVSLFDGDKQLGDPVKLDSQGIATFNIANLTIGTHTIKEAYSGDDAFATSNSVFQEIVNLARVNISGTSSANPATVGKSITLTSKVNATDAGAGTPTGIVTFYDGDKKLQDVTLNDQGVATFSTTLDAGKHNIREVYIGAGNFQGGETAFDQTINNTLAGVKFDNTIGPNPAVLGQAITFTSNLSAIDSTLGKPTGKVSFYDGETLLKEVNLQDGVATYSTTLGLGTHAIKEIYSGDNNFASITTDPITETINKNSANITTTALPDSSNSTSIIIKTTVAGLAGAATPTGVVSFFEGTNKLGEANLDQGIASLQVNLTSGKHTITEVYAGDNTFDTANGTLDATINANTPVISTTSSAATSTSGQNITFTSTITPSTGATGTPTGKVNFFDGNTLLGEGTLDSKGVATFTTSKLNAGQHNIKAVYAGDNNFLTITSTPLAETINPIGTVVTGTTSNPTAIAGRNIVFTSTVTSNNSAIVPTGTVTLFDGTKNLGTANLNKGVATFNIANLGVGKYNITEVYTSSDGKFSGSTSNVIGETVVPGVFNIENYLNLLVDKGSNLIDLLFNEKYYLSNNADVAAAVASGQVKSGLDHFLKYGEAEGRDPSLLFSNKLYLIENPDVATAISQGRFKSGLQHFEQFGLYERRDLRMLNFDEGWYLASNPDVKAAVDKGQYRYGYEHYLQFGQQEGRNPSPDFDEAYYLANNPDVKAAVARGTYQSGFDHFNRFGLYEGRNPNATFNNSQYLSSNPDVAAAIGKGSLRSGFDHALRSGQYEGRALEPQLYDEAYYLANNPDVKAAVANKQFRTAFDHFVLSGEKEGRRPSAYYDETYYLNQNPDVKAAVANGTFRSGFDHFAVTGRAEGRVGIA